MGAVRRATLGTSNNSATAFEGITHGIPYFSVEGGFYGEVLSVELTALTGEIRFTTDGRTPTLDDALYTEPLNADATTFLRARVFEDGHIPDRR